MRESERTIKSQVAEGDGKGKDKGHHAGITADQKAREAARQKIKDWQGGRDDTDFETVEVCTLLGS